MNGGYSSWADGTGVMNRHLVDEGRSVDLEMVDRRKHDATFQVLERCLECDAVLRGFATARIDEFLGRHGPSWASARMPRLRIRTSIDFHVGRGRPVPMIVQSQHDQTSGECATHSRFSAR
jgi:hypothetical protein